MEYQNWVESKPDSNLQQRYQTLLATLRAWVISGLIFLVGVWSSNPLLAETAVAGRNVVTIRGQKQEIYFYPAADARNRRNRKILFAPGDGGWRGFAVNIASTATSWGYDVFGLDRKRYLESLTGKMILRETDVMADFREIARWMTRATDEPVILVGWSEGAGLCLLAASSEENKKTFAGLISVGMTESNVLGWKWSDDLTYLTKKDPEEPAFLSTDFLPKVAPLPILMIHSTRDEYVPVEGAKRLFSVAQEPKRFLLIEARNHRFEGNQEQFFGRLREWLEWINQMSD
jgi:pimeloyl-ACP methyl ester carboxylesterase